MVNSVSVRSGPRSDTNIHACRLSGVNRVSVRNGAKSDTNLQPVKSRKVNPISLRQRLQVRHQFAPGQIDEVNRASAAAARSDTTAPDKLSDLTRLASQRPQVDHRLTPR